MINGIVFIVSFACVFEHRPFIARAAKQSSSFFLMVVTVSGKSSKIRPTDVENFLKALKFRDPEPNKNAIFSRW